MNNQSKKILLINMPFGSIERPSIGLSILKSQLKRVNIECDIEYFNFDLADIIGVDLYFRLCSMASDLDKDSVPHTLMIGEWLFSDLVNNSSPLQQKEYIDKVLKRYASNKNIDDILSVKERIPKFLLNCFNNTNWSKYHLIGFTSVFEQNLASLALAKIIKQKYPEKLIAFGGANVEGVMGKEVIKNYSFIDFVCTGEADIVFPELCKRIALEKDFYDVKGFLIRKGKEIIDNGSPDVINNLDSISIPNYDDYFTKLKSSKVKSFIKPWLQMESSRGCWWGEKHHCTFCGLNGRTMAYRKKSPQRVLNEMDTLIKKYSVRNISFVDNILDYEALKTYIPELSKYNKTSRIFFEVKSNMTRSQIKSLAEAGIKDIQPGIESLSSEVLKLMAKGVSGLQNIAFLKWTKKYGVNPMWNVLYGFPFEPIDEYSKQLELMKRITHLTPPLVIGRIRLDRFSPNYNKSALYGFDKVRPLKAYEYVYSNLGKESLNKICYFFDYEYMDNRKPDKYIKELVKFWLKWTRTLLIGDLKYSVQEDASIVIQDTRFNRIHSAYKLSAKQSFIYEFCGEKPKSLNSIYRAYNQEFKESQIEKSKLVSFLDYLWDNYLLVKENDNFFSVAIPN